jgi:predicted signal transduction protein with EAL and GGDEF domain
LRGHHLTASAGISIFPADSLSPEEVIQNANMAAFAGRRLGPNRVTVFKSRFAEDMRERWSSKSICAPPSPGARFMFTSSPSST